jgi:hypothetical protein
MIIAVIFLETMDKEPVLALVLLFFLSIGGAGMVLGRRRPLLCVPFLAVVVVMGYLGLLELNDEFVGPSIRREGGLVYVGLFYFAILAGTAMPLVGAVIGAGRSANGITPWRWISGAVGLPLMGLTSYMWYGYVKNAYYAYYLWPIEKAEDHYIMPLRWQHIVAQVTLTSVLIGLSVSSIYLLRSAFRPKEPTRQNIA